MRSDLGGGSIAALVSGLNAPSGVTIDGSHVYWTDLGTFNPLTGASNGDGKIMEANLEPRRDHPRLQPGQPYSVAVNCQPYLLDRQHVQRAHARRHDHGVRTDGTGAITLVSGLDCPDGVAVDSSHLYWSDGADGAVTADGLDGSSPNVVISGQFNVDAVAAG